MQSVVVHQVNHWLVRNSTDARHAVRLVAYKGDIRAGAYFHDGGAEGVRNGPQLELRQTTWPFSNHQSGHKNTHTDR